MSKAAKFKIELKNVGPHTNMLAEHEFGHFNVGIYANNGVGKTFISRMFRLASLKEDQLKKVNVDKYITLHQNNASFRFEILNSSNSVQKSHSLQITLSKGNEPIIKNDTDRIFHVFNSDYVSENLEAQKYSPDGNIDGYILGKTNIDLSKEKEELEQFIQKIDKLNDVIKNEVASKKAELDKLEIRKNTSEYALISTEEILKKLSNDETETTSNLIVLHGNLKAMPSDLQDIGEINTNFNTSFFTEIEGLLSKSYTRSSFAADFKDKISKKKQFITDGVNLLSSTEDKAHCPFCEQELKDDALKLIDLYNQFLNEVESQVGNNINRVNRLIDELEKEIKDKYNSFLSINSKFSDYKKYIPSFSKTELKAIPEHKDLSTAFTQIKTILEKKRFDITKTDLSCQTYFNQINSYIGNYKTTAIENNKTIKEFNLKKENSKTEKLNLNKRLCKAYYNELLNTLTATINDINTCNVEIIKINQTISDKENQVRYSKKKKVASFLKFYLNSFFRDKYQFDEINFKIKFLNTHLTNNASDVLSEGEKSIVAFCYFLAETHTRVNTENDYNKLFFIIDDPISSLDFHYVYNVCQIIRNLKSTIKSGQPLKFVRFIIFTHSIEFISILTRNKISRRRFILTSKGLSNLKDELVLPYEAHLFDIYSISLGDKQPAHTTPNSIRHILETINRFEAPHKNLDDYFNGIKLFEGNEFLYSLFHDNSHGGIRNERTYTDEMITEGCKALIKFIELKYEGQLKQISKFV